MNFIRSLAVAVSITFVPAPVLAQPQAVNTMIQAFQNWATANGIGNAALVISKDALEIGTSVVGTWTADTIAPIASTSKAITAICIMTLLDSRRIALTDTIQQLLPGFTNTLNAVGQGNAAVINVEHLLRHASGMEGNADLTAPREPTQVSYATGAGDPNPDQWFARQALNQPLFTAPGSNSAYANVNYAILGLIVKTITGESYENYCKRMVLTLHGAGQARIAAGNSAMEAFGGWSISAREYSKFYSQAFDRSALSELAKDFMDRVYDQSCRVCGYGLGVGITPVGYSCSAVPYSLPNTVSVMSSGTPRGTFMMPIAIRQSVLIAPTLHPDLPPYDLFHTGDWAGPTTPAQFSSIAAYWSNGVTAVMIADRQLGNALASLYSALSGPALTMN